MVFIFKHLTMTMLMYAFVKTKSCKNYVNYYVSFSHSIHVTSSLNEQTARTVTCLLFVFYICKTE